MLQNLSVMVLKYFNWTFDQAVKILLKVAKFFGRYKQYEHWISMKWKTSANYNAQRVTVAVLSKVSITLSNRKESIQNFCCLLFSIIFSNLVFFFSDTTLSEWFIAINFFLSILLNYEYFLISVEVRLRCFCLENLFYSLQFCSWEIYFEAFICSL